MPLDLSGSKLYSSSIGPVGEALNYSDISTNGLIIRVDAGNPNSYSGSGSTWTDISGNGNSATLVGLGYTSLNGGSITFPGSGGSYATFGDKNAFTTLFSFFVFINRGNSSNARVVSKDIGYYTNREYALQLNASGVISSIVWNQSGSIAIASGGAGAAAGGWACVGTTWDGGTIRSYLNGTEVSSIGLSGSSPYNSSVPLELGRVQDGGFEPFTGNMAIFLMYNRAVSATEAGQIFNAYRGRFGI
jgi:hypothetical protein